MIKQKRQSNTPVKPFSVLVERMRCDRIVYKIETVCKFVVTNKSKVEVEKTRICAMHTLHRQHNKTFNSFILSPKLEDSKGVLHWMQLLLFQLDAFFIPVSLPFVLGNRLSFVRHSFRSLRSLLLYVRSLIIDIMGVVCWLGKSVLKTTQMCIQSF